jgi:hypothetical protein
LIKVLKEFKDKKNSTYKDLKRIPPNIIHHRIELDTTIPPTHQARCRLNFNYVIIVKQDVDKLFNVGFIKSVEEKTSWLSPTVFVPNKNGKLKMYIDFKKLKISTKKDLCSLPFMDEVINKVIGHKVYPFLMDFKDIIRYQLH